MILQLNQIDRDSVMTSGGKGANLGELVALGVNVPEGFVITSDIYNLYIEENRIKESTSDEKKLLSSLPHIRERIKKGKFNEEIKALIKENYLKLGNDERVAVRSSATAEDLSDASFAGQQETFLNIQGIDEILSKIKSCYASLWSDRAVSYRKKQNYEKNDLSMAVVIQKMIESEKSGVLFTVNPVNKNKKEILINANYGLGESVVSGTVTADSYIIGKAGTIIDITIGKKQTQIIYSNLGTKEVELEENKKLEKVLNKGEIDNLLKVALKLEKHYGYPLDIEWAIRNNKIYILQARAITTLEEEKEIPEHITNVKIKKYNQELVSFLIEKIPFVFRAIEFDYFTAVSEQKNTIFAENGINITPNLHMDYDGIMSIRREKMSFNSNIFKIFGLIKELRDYSHCADKCNTFIEDYKKKLKKLKELDFANMSLSECKDFIIYSYELTKDSSYKRFKYAVFPSIFNKGIVKSLKKIDKNYTSFDLYWGLNNRSSLIVKDITKVANDIKNNIEIKKAIIDGLKYNELSNKFSKFKSLTGEFIERSGFASEHNSYCIAEKSFIEDPDRILEIIRPLLSEDKISHIENENKDFNEITNAFKKIYGNKYPKIESKINSYRFFHFTREEGQYFYEIIFFYLRKCLKRVNALLLGNENYTVGISNLFYAELIKVLEKGFLDESDMEKIRKRNENIPYTQKVWNASKSILYKDTGNILSGISGNTGIAVGKVCIVNSSKEFYKLKKGDILVCPFTAPEWTPLFKLASAVVANTGSALSHAAIVAREFGIPAVLGTGFATDKLRDGDMIKIDGFKGEITSLQK